MSVKSGLRLGFILIVLICSSAARADPEEDCADTGILYRFPTPAGGDQQLRNLAQAANQAKDRTVIEQLMLRGLPASDVHGALHPFAAQMQKNVQLIGAAARGNNKVVRTLLDGGADINYVPHFDTLLPALIMASLCDRPSTVTLLLDRGADPNVRGTTYTQYGCATNITALSWAEFLRHRKVAKLLTERGEIRGVQEIIHDLGPTQSSH